MNHIGSDEGLNKYSLEDYTCCPPRHSAVCGTHSDLRSLLKSETGNTKSPRCAAMTCNDGTRWADVPSKRRKRARSTRYARSGSGEERVLVPSPLGATCPNRCDYWPETQRPADLYQRVIGAQRVFSPYIWWRRGESNPRPGAFPQRRLRV